MGCIGIPKSIPDFGILREIMKKYTGTRIPGTPLTRPDRYIGVTPLVEEGGLLPLITPPPPT